MENRLRYKGKFIKKKVLEKKIRIRDSAHKRITNKLENETESVKPNLIEGSRVVELTELGKNLKCCRCNDVLCLDNIIDEIRTGLHSILKVKCINCNAITRVSTGKSHVINNDNKCKHFDSTTGIVLGKF